MPVAVVDGLQVLMPNAELWNVLPPHQHGANVSAAILDFAAKHRK